MSIKLPISKSIANRILLLQAIHGDELMPVSYDMPDDVIVLHDALARLRDYKKGEPLTLYLKNCGTALRFLQVHLAKCYPGEPITLTGDPRLMERDGKPTTQTTSALILHGEDVPIEKDESPYITMSRRLAAMYQPSLADSIEADWSAAAFWYEYVAIHGGSLVLEGLKADSLQGDKIVAEIYAQYFGVDTTFLPDGIRVTTGQLRSNHGVILDFRQTPDLYPSVALTCERLGIDLQATGIENLRNKESDRIEAVKNHEVRNDHRMAMALMCADYPVSIEEQACIAKSYPNFVPQHITPIKGVNDEGKGKKHALSKLIHASTSEYIWLHDDDVVLPEATKKAVVLDGDVIILPLKMESQNEHPSLLESLQIAEYAAIQEITMSTAKAGRAVMCSGANLIVRREVWLACEAELHPEIPSGDDMFLLEAAKRHGYKISVIDEPDYTAIVRPHTNAKTLFLQRTRWAGKAPHYTDSDIILCGWLVIIANILQFLFTPLVLIKFPFEYSLIIKREPQTRWFVALLLEMIYPYYMFACLVCGLFRRNKW